VSKMRLLCCLGAIMCLVLPSCASPRRAFDILHERPDDASLKQSNIVARVLIFVSNDCPIANRYSPEIRKLHESYAPRGIAFWLVHSDPEETLDNVRQHDREFNLNVPTVLDPDHALVRLCKAEIVPSVAVFAADGRLVYRGRIDDRFAELGRERPQPSRRDLQEALDAILANRPITVSSTKAVGCYIP